jgi:hypothetical protein
MICNWLILVDPERLVMDRSWWTLKDLQLISLGGPCSQWRVDCSEKKQRSRRRYLSSRLGLWKYTNGIVHLQKMEVYVLNISLTYIFEIVHRCITFNLQTSSVSFFIWQNEKERSLESGSHTVVQECDWWLIACLHLMKEMEPVI